MTDGGAKLNSMPTVSGEMTFYAHYSTTPRYAITFANYDGTQLQKESVTQGESPVYNGLTPGRARDLDGYFRFIGWKDSKGTDFAPNATLPAVTGKETYTAQYDYVTELYTITLNNIDGAGPNGVEALAVNGQFFVIIVPCHINASTAFGGDCHRFAVAEDKCHIVGENEGVVVCDVVVHYIPARIERCFVTREHGVVAASVLHIVPVDIVDGKDVWMQGLVPDGIDLDLVERVTEDDLFALVVFVIESLAALDGDGTVSIIGYVTTSAYIVVGVGPAEGDVTASLDAGCLHLAAVDSQSFSFDALVAGTGLNAAAVDGHSSCADAIRLSVRINAAAVLGIVPKVDSVMPPIGSDIEGASHVGVETLAV